MLETLAVLISIQLSAISDQQKGSELRAES